MLERINPFILNAVSDDYASEESCPDTCLDCSMGANPYDAPPEVMRAVRQMSMAQVKQYPHDSDVVDGIIGYLSPVYRAGRRNIILGCGSLNILLLINRAFLRPGSVVFGVTPGFSAYTDDLKYSGAEYHSLQMLRQDGFAFSADAFLAGLDAETPDMICLENPNNPTGQIYPVADVRRIAEAARARNIPLIVDEAYGDYMPLENSAVSLMGEFDNIIVARSFSKGFGVAGVRMGYMIAPGEAADQLRKIASPYDCNSVARLVAKAILDTPGYVEGVRARVGSEKPQVLAALRNIKAAKTADTTPISLLYCNDPDIDLCAHLREHGIYAISGKSFAGAGKNCVRMMLNPDYMELAKRLKSADAALDSLAAPNA